MRYNDEKPVSMRFWVRVRYVWKQMKSRGERPYSILNAGLVALAATATLILGLWGMSIFNHHSDALADKIERMSIEVDYRALSDPKEWFNEDRLADIRRCPHVKKAFGPNIL